MAATRTITGLDNVKAKAWKFTPAATPQPAAEPPADNTAAPQQPHRLLSFLRRVVAWTAGGVAVGAALGLSPTIVGALACAAAAVYCRI